MAVDIAHGIIIDFGPLSIKCQRYNYVTYISRDIYVTASHDVFLL